METEYFYIELTTISLPSRSELESYKISKKAASTNILLNHKSKNLTKIKQMIIIKLKKNYLQIFILSLIAQNYLID